MLRTIALITPVFVTLLWSITLAGDFKKYSNPRIFLSWFMLLPLIIFIAHFLYFAPLPNIYPYFDIVLQTASLMVFPAYHVYFRLLTVDDKFSIKSHIKYFYIAMFCTVAYAAIVILTPKIEYRAWLFDKKVLGKSYYIHALDVSRTIIRIVYLFQIVFTVVGNSILIKKYGSKAEQYYSDVEDGKYNNAQMLNYSVIFVSIWSFIIATIGRYYIKSDDIVICLGWFAFSITLFVIGYLGITQKPVNPTFESLSEGLENEFVELTNQNQKNLLDKLLVEVEIKKAYLNSNLNILDVVQAVGSNRTTISNLINKNYNQNFCSFINGYRINELKKVYNENPHYTNEILAQECGFGSLKSLKRAVTAKTGLSLSEWKKNL